MPTVGFDELFFPVINSGPPGFKVPFELPIPAFYRGRVEAPNVQCTVTMGHRSHGVYELRSMILLHHLAKSFLLLTDYYIECR